LNANPQTNNSGQGNDISLNIQDEIETLRQKINSVTLPEGLKNKAEGMILRLVRMTQQGNYSNEFEPVAEYINWIIQIPWGSYTSDNLDMQHAKEILDKHHFGLDPVKNRVLQHLAIMNLNVKSAQAAPDNSQDDVSSEMSRLQGSSSHAPILCFVGIQGVGKTSMAKSIATALNRKFVRVSLGAMGSVTELRGRSRGEPDAEPGQIIKGLIRTGSMNPLILLDEIDKTSSATGLRADIMAALLEILDPEQNSTFMDKYLDFPVDLSKVMFITTANNLGGISAALLDRLEVIRFGSYTDAEKIMIAKNYLLPKVREATGITEAQLSFADDAWELVVRPLGFDAGVRQLERTLTELCRKVAMQIVQGLSTGVKITKENFRQYIPEDIGIYS
jgi:ATP-dependent Lon protease